MPTRRDTLALGVSATLGVLAGAGRASASADTGIIPGLQTRLFNFKEDVPREKIADIVSGLKTRAKAPGIDGFMIGRNFIPTPFPGRFEWIYMLQTGGSDAPDGPAAYRDFKRLADDLTRHCRDHVECDLKSSLPSRFADASGVKVRHTVMFDFKPDASPEARARNVDAIRGMGRLPMVQHYVVEQAAIDPSDPARMQWQVIGDFGSIEDYTAYSQAPVHLAIRDDFKVHTSRVAFLDVQV